MSWEDVVKKPFIYGEDKLPSEEMKKFLLKLQNVISAHDSKDEEVIDLANRLEDFLQLSGPSGRNLNLKDRVKRIQGRAEE